MEVIFLLSVVVPCYNEISREGFSFINRVEYLVADLFMEFDDNEYEIILVSDGSTDGTDMQIIDLSYRYSFVKSVVYTKNRGKGYAIKRGVLRANGDVILIMDADLSTDISNIKPFYNKIDVYDGVIGIRSVGYNTNARRVLSTLSHFCMTRVLHLHVKDTQCGFKMFKADIIKKFCTDFQTCDKWLFDAELLVFLEQNRFKVRSELVEWNNSEDSRVKVFGGTLTSCFELLRISRHIKDYRL